MPTLVTNPASVVEHIIHKEVQYDSTIEPTYNEITVDEDSYNENIGEYGINDDINLAFDQAAWTNIQMGIFQLAAFDTNSYYIFVPFMN